MEFDTTPITNIGDEQFVGKYNGVEFSFQPKETRYLPTEVSIHLSKQLRMELEKRLRKDKQFDEKGFLESLNGILATEIKTKVDSSIYGFAEKVRLHEQAFGQWQEERKKEDMLKAEKVNQIINNHA